MNALRATTFVSLSVFWSACGGQGAAKPAAPEAAGAALAGDYACSFTGYPEFLCRVSGDGPALVLEKLGGSDRFRGALTAAGDDLAWKNESADGTPTELVFKKQGDGSWYAALPSDGEAVGYRLRALGPLGSQFGGQAYGGAIGESPQ